MASGLGSATRSFFAGGRTPSLLNRIDYIDSSATGNFSDFGDLTAAKRLAGACGNRIQGHLGGGNPSSNIIEKITYATIGNAVETLQILVIFLLPQEDLLVLALLREVYI